MDRDPTRVLDELLVAAARAGSSAAFGQLVLRWTPRLRQHAERLLFSAEEAGDVTQDAWLHIARNLSRLQDTARFPGWAFAIVTRRAIDFIRRRSRERRTVGAAAAETLAGPASAHGAAGLDASLDLRAAIRRLPVDQRLMVSLHYGEGLSVEEIATAHGLAAGTVKSRLHAARQTLKNSLEGDGHDEC
ncbi:MAG: RNA polymerase sigma factor [Phenylobacterium sp.]